MTINNAVPERNNNAAKSTFPAQTDLLDRVLRILEEEIIPAEGCTEPIALAYVAALAAEYLGQTAESMKIFVSGNILKNVKSVVVPNSGGLTGIKVSAAMGFVAGKTNRELMVISDVTPSDMERVRLFMDNCEIEVLHEKTDIALYVRIEAAAGNETSLVEMKHVHTNITRIEKNGSVVLARPCNDADFNSPLTDRKILSVELIYNLARSIDLSLIRPLFMKVVKLNSQIAEEGLREVWGVNVGSRILKNIESGIYGDDARNQCASFAAAGSDARMSGCPLPVMTTCGSGNVGMAASLPVIRYCQLKNFTEDEMIRALFFSHLAAIHIKTNVGRLSAHCGAVCAAAALGGALAFVNNGDLTAVANAIVNTLGNISGMICDGAKASCALKIATGIYAAFDAATLGFYNRALHSGDGIIGRDVEDTIRNIGELSRAGMQHTDEVILELMMK
ncbi:MAG: hypothetical protein CVV64_15970 [Candidatus Wallbacteria bacterium HGW-Wallbacteria-1]|jgi:L-cysteine desulfidase|uniref:UPF0597 protein CVV64_15970 n=1 Tax=Candidatus Wallbacteria bacterium HGW-Wallbacteria-1 TaxID=2013854 RepID=A0A2N1PL94_9BACT|nr:MAG: hypothetical protein CVV64_15970 [Candidatus Wallbacteria bacterium HGW-Wallbacteria-1]